MNVSKISFKSNNEHKRTHMVAPATGYAAAGTIALSVASGFSKQKPMRNVHKISAVLSALLVAAHIISIEAFKSHHKKHA